MKALLLLALVGGLIGRADAQDPAAAFSEANALYQEGRFPEARDRYEAILGTGLESHDIYLNLGNTYFRMRDVGRAVLNYERGLRLSPTDDDLLYNRNLAGLMTVDKIEKVPRLFLWDYWDGLKSAFSPEGLFWAAWMFYLTLFAALTAVVLAGSYVLRKISLFVMAGAATFFLLLVLLGLDRYSDLSRSDTAIILSEIVTIKNSPDSRDTDTFVLHSGAKIRITDSVGDWIKIQLEDGKVGWVERDAAEII